MARVLADAFAVLPGDVELVVNQALEGQKRLTSEVHLGALDQVNGKVFNAVDRADILFVDIDPANDAELQMLKRIASERHGRGGGQLCCER